MYSWTPAALTEIICRIYWSSKWGYTWSDTLYKAIRW